MRNEKTSRKVESLKTMLALLTQCGGLSARLPEGGADPGNSGGRSSGCRRRLNSCSSAGASWVLLRMTQLSKLGGATRCSLELETGDFRCQ